MASLREDLITAKALIDTPEKWGKGAYEPRPQCYCTLGALGQAICGTPDAAEYKGSERLYAAIDALEAKLPDRVSSAATFNDRRATTHADIMALFDRAIASPVSDAQGGR